MISRKTMLHFTSIHYLHLVMHVQTVALLILVVLNQGTVSNFMMSVKKSCVSNRPAGWRPVRPLAPATSRHWQCRPLPRTALPLDTNSFQHLINMVHYYLSPYVQNWQCECGHLCKLHMLLTNFQVTALIIRIEH